MNSNSRHLDRVVVCCSRCGKQVKFYKLSAILDHLDSSIGRVFYPLNEEHESMVDGSLALIAIKDLSTLTTFASCAKPSLRACMR